MAVETAACEACQREEHWECEGCPCDHPSTVIDFDSLTRAFRHIRTARSRISEITLTVKKDIEEHEREIERLTLWLTHETEKDRRQIAYWQSQAEQLLAAQIAERPRGPKTIPTPYGSISRRDPADEWEYERDPERLQAWARAHGFVRRTEKVTEAVDWATIKASCTVEQGQLITPDGLVVEGVVARPKSPTYRIEVPD
jgi:hypothetical protein